MCCDVIMKWADFLKEEIENSKPRSLRPMNAYKQIAIVPVLEEFSGPKIIKKNKATREGATFGEFFRRAAPLAEKNNKRSGIGQLK